MAWVAPRTWVASEVVTAAMLNQHVRDNLNALNGYVRKTADQSVTSSIVLVNDSVLSLAIPAPGTYVIDTYLIASSAANSAGDINVGFGFPTGTLDFFCIGAIDPALTAGSIGTVNNNAILTATSGTSVIGLGLSTSINGIHVHANFVATASGTLNFMWCQNSSNASASTVKAGSHMTMRQVA